MHSPCHEIVLESEGFPLSSEELLCLESTREAVFCYIPVIPLFYVRLSKEEGNINWISPNTKSWKMSVRIYIVATSPHRNANSKYCPCADLITKS